MTTESKARDFFVQHLEGMVLGAAVTKIHKDDIHVIEKSYADQIQAQLKAKDELLRECEKAMEAVLYNNHTTTLRFSELIYLALRKIKKLREGKS